MIRFSAFSTCIKRVFSVHAASILAFLLSGALLAGCITINLPAAPTPTPLPVTLPEMPTSTQAPTETAYLAPTPTPLPTETPYLAPTPTIDYTLTPPPDGAPRSLYFLAQSGVWVLRPNADKAERLTPQDSLVTAFDVWPEDGRLAYATKSGKLYVVQPDRSPRLLMRLDVDATYPIVINGLAWSPDGSQLAYTVDLEDGGSTVTMENATNPLGVSTIPLEGGPPTFLISNRYLSPTGPDVNKIRHFSNPRWSPDGKALLLSAAYWEWSSEHWLYPLEYSDEDQNLHSVVPPTGSGLDMWGSATWLPDSQGLLFSGQGSTLYSDLVWASRDGTQTDLERSGKLGGVYIYDAQMLPENSFISSSTAGMAAGPGRILYLARCPECARLPRASLWASKSKRVDPSQNGGGIGPEELCSLSDSFGNRNEPRHIEWRPDYSTGVVICGSNEIYLIHMRQANPTLTTLLPVLPTLTPEQVPHFRWGEILR